MNPRIRLAALILPPWTIRRELRRIDEATTCALDLLLEERAPEALEAIRREEGRRAGSVTARREGMARAHDRRVAALLEAAGGEEGMLLARRALFEAGASLGEEARRRLRLGRKDAELLLAARVLYRVLGIRFRAEWDGPGAACVRIDRCALARIYSPEACLALSAADEGVVAGLRPGARLRFAERMTEGKRCCLARLELPQGDGEKGR